jgi:RNA polymerase sigma-70 factor, ECF subfamily
MAAMNGLLLAVAAQPGLDRSRSRSGRETLLDTGAQNMTQANPDINSPSEDAAVEAFVALLMEHRHRIYAFIAKQLVNHADVEDVFQRTSLVLWKKMRDFDSNGSFFHWACGVAYNEVRNFLTVQRRSRLHFDSDLVELMAHEARDEGELSEARLTALRNCVAKLHDSQQQTLRQCYAGTESITEVAESLGRNRGALYKQLARLRAGLLDCIRSRLAQEGFGR